MTLKKALKKKVDRSFGNIARWALYWLLWPYVKYRFKFVITGAEQALECTEGSLIISNHISRWDPPVIIFAAWPYAFVRMTPWHAQYSHPVQLPFMKIFSAVSVGSPSKPPKNFLRQASHDLRQEAWKKERERKRATTAAILRKLMAMNRHIAFFGEGGIGDGKTVKIPLHFHGVYDLMVDFPEKPVLVVKLAGLHNQPNPFWPPRQLVTIDIKRFDKVSLEGGPPALNTSLMAFYNEGVPLPTKQSIAA